MSFDEEDPKIYKNIVSNNYLSNSYAHLTRIKGIHFLFTLIEILLNIFLELETFIRNYNLENITNNNTDLNIVSYITICFNKISTILKFIVIVLFIIIFDSLYIFIKVKKFKLKHIRLSIIINLLELFIYRTFMIIFLNLFFTLKKEFLILGFLFLIPHIYLILNNFLYNHLYYFVPVFIDYPYDEFSSIFDIILLFIKLLLSVAGTSNNSNLGKFCFIIMLSIQTFFSLYFIYKLNAHSYLFMKNTFLNITKISLYFSQTFILIIGLLLGRSEIMTVLFLIISISILLILMGYMYFIYNPFSHIIIGRKTPMENTIFYLYILSEQNDFEFILENKINQHYKNCGICNLCDKYIKYLNNYKNKNKNIKPDEEKEKLINEESIQNENNKEQLMDLLDVIYDNKNKYFHLIKQIVINHKYNGKKYLKKNSYYFINLSYLIYSDYQNNNITLALNERIILEVINQENNAFLDNHESQILQIFLTNQFISLSKKILEKLKDILISEQPNFNKAKKLIDLSALIKKLKDPIYKNNLFSHKSENISNSKHLILICSIIYEEIFNTSLNNSQIPIRDNIQPLEDIFHNNSNKINKIITLSLTLTNRTCKIIRAGKGLSSYINNNLFDLFPLIFKQYQINLFMSTIFQNFKNENNKEKNTNIKTKKYPKLSTQIIKSEIKGVKNNKNNYVEIKLIICENISSKIYFKLLTLNLLPLFNNNMSNYIVFDGFYYIHRNTLITLKDLEENKDLEKIIAVSEPELEKNNDAYFIPFKKYIIWQNNEGFIISKISSFNISLKVFNIYMVTKNEKNNIYKKRLESKKSQIKIETEEEEFQTSVNKNSKIEKIQLLEDNASVSSQNTNSTYNMGFSNLGMRNKKKDNIYEYGAFNKIKTLIIIVILVSLLAILIEYIILNILQKNTINNIISLLEYREFSKLYFQLFSSILSIACIDTEKGCIKIIDNFIESYFEDNNQEYFDYNSLIMIQNIILAKKIMEKRNYLVNIHQCIGNQKYNELFGANIKYSKVNQNMINNKYFFNTTIIEMKFSEAILAICNSFQILAKGTNNKFFILASLDDPFYYLNNIINQAYSLNDYQKELYEMILNYKYYFAQFDIINEKLQNIIYTKSAYISIFVYFYITFDAILIFLIGISVYIYTFSFEIILIKIINFINMTINTKNDGFNFSEKYIKKIEILENILEFYNSDPITEIQNLNSIYIEYQQFLSAKNKSNAMEMNKKNYKKIIEDNKKNELDNVPKNQKIITKKDVKFLGITSIYYFMYYITTIMLISLYVLVFFIWNDYFSKKTNLFSLITKNNHLETSIYKAINYYDLMIFHCITLEQVSNIVKKDENDKKDSYGFLKSFYEDLKLAFNGKKEKNSLGSIYQDIEDISDFTCEKIYELNNDFIKEIENNTLLGGSKNITNILVKLCESGKITQTKDYRSIFERHFQYIRNGILNINDSSYNGIIDHIINDSSLSRISLFFDFVIIYILELTNTKPHKEAFDRLMNKLKGIIQISQIIFLIFNIIAILLTIFLFISGINNLLNQIFLLKKVFKIFEIQE